MERMITKWKSAALAVAAAVMMAGMSLTAFAADDPTTFVKGTSVNGIGVGGMTVEAAKAQIESFYVGNYSLTIKERDKKSEEIKGTEIGFQVSVPDGLQAILDEQNATGRLSGPSVDNKHTFQMANVFDDALLTAKINSLHCISGADIVKTQNASIGTYQEGVGFTIVPAVAGNSVDVEKTTDLIKQAVGNGLEELDLEQYQCYENVTVATDNPDLIARCNVMNQVGNLSITYTFGSRSEVLDGATITTWLLGADQNGVIQVDQNQVAAYVANLAAKYDTAGTTRTFKTASGTDVALSGAYGWKIDQAAEIPALIAAIQGAQSVTKEPAYAKTAASHDGYDWGGTYVEVDLGGQHVYMVQDNVLVWDAPCVTGNVSKNYTTPPGIFTLTYKEKDRVLRGAKKADGSYEYESHVDYWMPFNGGIGLHDASWRSNFGGNIYKTSGSHGCINLPPAKAATLYNLINKGTVVICHN